MSTAQDLPVPYGEPLHGPALRLVPSVPLDFEDAVRRIRPRLHRYAVRRLGDLHEAEELVQEALLRAYSHRAQLLTEDDLAAWTTVVTGRLVIDRLRVRGRSVSVADVPEGNRVSRDTADVVVARDEARLALDALDAMHPRQAALLWAREVEGQSYEDLCARFGMSEPAVRSVLTRARKALRKEYGLRGGTLPVGGLAVLAPWVTGLGWADRIRHVATKLTAPAALSAIGITALGGLVLSPFNLLPPNGPTAINPAIAVVSTPAAEVFRHDDVRPVASLPRTRATSTHPSAPAGAQVGVVHQVTHAVPCSATSEDPSTAQERTVSLGPVTLGDPTVERDDCGTATATSGNVLYTVPVLPSNPTGARHISVTSDYIDCSYVASNPLLACAPENTQQGEPQ